MSYAYIANVYKDFKPSKNLDNVYNSIVNPTQTESSLPIPLGAVDELNQLAKHYKIGSIERFENEQPLPQERDNLHYYKTPMAPMMPKSSMKQSSVVEKFSQEKPEGQNSLEEKSCDLYTSHVAGCSKCKAVLMKQFQVENDRIQREQVLEVTSLLIFGAFALLLIDSLKKK